MRSPKGVPAQKTDERSRELLTLLEITRDVTSNLSLDSVLEEILEKLNTVVPYTNCTILKLEGDMFQTIAYKGVYPKEQTLLIRFSADNPIDRKVLSTRQPVIISDVFYEDSELARDFRAQAGDALQSYYKFTRTWMRVPLIYRDEVIGLLTLHFSEPDYYSTHHANLALTFAGHAAVAIENARLYQQARQLAALEERQKLARELHDSVSQVLYGIALGARTARALLKRDPGKVEEPLEYISSLAEAGLAEMRALIFELRPETLQQSGLVAALSKQIEVMRSRHHLKVEMSLGQEPEVSFEVKEAIYRVAQEAFHNVVKHARARQISIALASGQGLLKMEIRDDGVGFDTTAEFPGHLGLRSMRERVELAKGEFSLESLPGQGTAIKVAFPLDPRS